MLHKFTNVSSRFAIDNYNGNIGIQSNLPMNRRVLYRVSNSIDYRSLLDKPFSVAAFYLRLLCVEDVSVYKTKNIYLLEKIST